jgi:aryl-alcohol dehydrogenase-like predicted oxidoreductase
VEHPGEETETEVKRFLEELNMNYIDGLLLHGWGFSGNWNTEYSDYLTAFDKLKERGIIRSHGLSSHSLEAVKTAVNEPWVDAMHVRYNAYGDSMDDTVEKVEPVVKQLHQAGKGVIAMKVVGEGAFANDDEKKDNSFKFVLLSGAVDVMTVGMDKISDIVDCESRIRKVIKG